MRENWIRRKGGAAAHKPPRGDFRRLDFGTMATQQEHGHYATLSGVAQHLVTLFCFAKIE